MPNVDIDGITTRYEIKGSGSPILMYAPGGFNAVVEAWSTLGIYAKVKLLDHLPQKFTCILFDRRECGQSGGRVEPITWMHFVAQGKGLAVPGAAKKHRFSQDDLTPEAARLNRLRQRRHVPEVAQEGLLAGICIGAGRGNGHRHQFQS